jgi:hypothetical protein
MSGIGIFPTDSSPYPERAFPEHAGKREARCADSASDWLPISDKSIFRSIAPLFTDVDL